MGALRSEQSPNAVLSNISMGEHTNNQEAIQKIRDLMKDIKIAMLVTESENGALRSRPMALQASEFNGDLWFLTGEQTPKVDELERNSRVNVSLANPGKSDYVSLSGTVEISRDQSKINELWSPFYEAWFPQGKEDPSIRTLKVVVEEAEYWDAPSSKMVQLYMMAKQAITGKREDMGENERVHMDKGYVG